VLKLNYLATAEAYQMMMLCLPLGLIMVVFLSETSLLHQAKLFEQTKRAIDCRKADARLPVLGQAIKLIGVKMALRLT